MCIGMCSWGQRESSGLSLEQALLEEARNVATAGTKD